MYPGMASAGESIPAFTGHLLSIIPLKTEMGTIVQWIGFLVDIHAQKLIEQTLKDNSEDWHSAKKIVERHQGFITASSTLGESAMFKIYLPL